MRLRARLEQLGRDVRHAVRLLARERTFAVTGIATLALGLGATIAIFSVVDSELWKPLPFPNPDRLVAVYSTAPGGIYDRVSAAEVLDWRREANTFDGIAAFGSTSRRVLRGIESPASIRVLPVTSNFFDVLGRKPALGRAFTTGDERELRGAILTDDGWRRHFGGSASALGADVIVGDVPYTIVGIAGPEARLEFMGEPDVFVVMRLQVSEPRTSRTLSVLGRLKEQATVDAAGADLRVVARRLEARHPDEHAGRGVMVQELREANLGWNWRPLFFCLGAALFVLALTCTNLAALFVARTLRRQQEIAVRRALGAGLGAIMQQMFVEAAVVSALALTAGLLLASWLLGALPAWLPADYLGRRVPAGLDGRSTLVALLLTVAATVACGVAPSILAFRRHSLTLGSGARTAGDARPQQRARTVLVALEIALAMVLIFGAGLFMTSFNRLLDVPLGFEPADRVTVSVPLFSRRYLGEPVVRFADDVMDRVSAVPGITAVSMGSSMPLGSGPLLRFARADRPVPGAPDLARSIIRTIAPRYFEALGIRRLSGRDFSATDVGGAPRVAIVNATLAHRLFPGESALGRELRLFPPSTMPWIPREPVTIVGIVDNIKEVGINEVAMSDIYLPLMQSPNPSLQLVARTGLPTESVARAVREAVAAIDPTLPVASVRTMDDAVAEALKGDRFHLLLTGLFAVLALAMAALGVYGATAYSVEQRTKEFGVRMALGAAPAAILSLALRGTMRVGIAGAAGGVLLSLLVARLMGDALYLVPGQHNGLLYGVSLRDPATLTAAAAVLLGIVFVAVTIPARRAARVNPMVALRAE